MWTIQTCLSSIVSMLAWDRIIKKKNEKEITPFPHGNIQSVPCASILRLTNNAPKQQYYNNETFWKTKDSPSRRVLDDSWDGEVDVGGRGNLKTC